MKKKDILELDNFDDDDMEEFENGAVLFSKVSFDHMVGIYVALSETFDTANEEKEPDQRFEVLWHNALILCGWDEEEFFDELSDRTDGCNCSSCDCEDDPDDGENKDFN